MSVLDVHKAILFDDGIHSCVIRRSISVAVRSFRKHFSQGRCQKLPRDHLQHCWSSSPRKIASNEFVVASITESTKQVCDTMIEKITMSNHRIIQNWSDRAKLKQITPAMYITWNSPAKLQLSTIFWNFISEAKSTRICILKFFRFG